MYCILFYYIEICLIYLYIPLRSEEMKSENIIILCILTHCLLMPFETHRQITVEANVAGGYIDTGNINVSINLQWMLSNQLCKS